MGITSAFANATTGLAASARAIQVASANIANVMTEGYAPRQIDLSAASLAGIGGGVRIAGISRQSDPILLGLTRDASAADQASTQVARFWSDIETAMGIPEGGISAGISALETALISASERPDQESRLVRVLSAADDLTTRFDHVQGAIRTARVNADALIARDIESLNSALARVDNLNHQIVQLNAAGQSTLGLQDDRQATISAISEIVPVREFARADGRVTLYSKGGQLLLDLEPQSFAFTPNPVLDESMTVGSGLSGITVGGIALNTGHDSPLQGGRLAAAFQVRDVSSQDAQRQLDALAENLIARFQNTGVDPTLTAADAGLFTDDGAPLGVGYAPGLAGRLHVNAAVDPAQGGEITRLRDGINAGTAGPVGEAAQITRLLDALTHRIIPPLGGAAVSFHDASASIGSLFSSSRQSAEDTATSTAARFAELTERTLSQGVDTDAEMQRLLQIEQAYAANARVIETADAMLRRLLEI